MTLKFLKSDRLTPAHLLMAAVMAAAGMAATWAAWRDIYVIAKNDEEYSHIFLVPLVALYLVWVRRMRVRHCKPSFRMVGPIVVALGWAIGSFGFYRDVQFMFHGGAVLVVLGCALSILGKNVALRFMPAISVLAFLVPVPVRVRLAIATPLQSWTARVDEKLLEGCGVIDTEVTGNVLKVNDKPVTVAEACNGLRMVFALVLVSFAFAFGMPLRNAVRVIVLLCSPLAAIFCNVVRTLPTIYLYGYGSQAVADTFHTWAGWAMLPVAFLLLYSIIKLMQWAMIPVTEYTLAAAPQ